MLFLQSNPEAYAQLFFPVCFDLKNHILTAERATPSITTTSHLSVNSFIENHLCFFCVCVCV